MSPIGTWSHSGGWVRGAAWPLAVLAEPPNMIDIVPTILDAAGITAPAIVGRPRKMRAQHRD
jgi:arylsulfatase A-like enzyme